MVKILLYFGVFCMVLGLFCMCIRLIGKLVFVVVFNVLGLESEWILLIICVFVFVVLWIILGLEVFIEIYILKCCVIVFSIGIM